MKVAGLALTLTVLGGPIAAPIHSPAPTGILVVPSHTPTPTPHPVGSPHPSSRASAHATNHAVTPRPIGHPSRFAAGLSGIDGRWVALLSVLALGALIAGLAARRD